MRLPFRDRSFGHLGLSLALITLLSLSSGCGLQLRGGLAVPERLQSLYLQGDERSPIFQTVERSFESSGVTLVNSAAQAPYQINLIRAQHQRRSASLNENAKTQEYELRAQLSYSIEDNSGAILVKPTEIYTERTYGYDEDHVNAKEAEEELLLQEMRENLARQLVRRYLKLAEINSR
ncbi:MAG: LPS-assembly lipoprotein [Motiliproteus sp.]|jgi:LPS-assembly lipoprotein